MSRNEIVKETKLLISPSMSPLNIQTNTKIQPLQISPSFITTRNEGTMVNKSSITSDRRVITTENLQDEDKCGSFANNRISSNSTYNMSTNLTLYQIISTDVQQPRHKEITERNLDSRNTIVKKAPDGAAVQITYKNMINNQPGVKCKRFILPYPNHLSTETTLHHSNNFSNFINKSYSTKDSDRTSTNVYSHTPSLYVTTSPAIVDSTEHYTNSGPAPTTTFPHSCLLKHTSLINMNTQNESFTCANTNHNRDTTELSPSHSSHQNGNLSICFPKMPMSNTNNSNDQLTEDDASEMSDVETFGFAGIDINLDCLNSFNDSQFFQSEQGNICNDDTGDIFLLSDVREESTMNNETNKQSGENLQFNVSCSNTASFIDLRAPQLNSSSTSVGEQRNVNGYCNELQNHLIDQNYSAQNEFTEQNELIDITDVSPEVAPTCGGSKIILIGSWNVKDSRYQCKFGNILVDAELVQNGVLRCYSPLHPPMKVKLRVYCNKRVISNDTDFTFHTSNHNNISSKNMHEEWSGITEESFVNLLVQRITFISEMFQQPDCVEMSAVILVTNVDNVIETCSSNVEEKLVEVCKKLMHVSDDVEFTYDVENSFTLLHLASALGYLKLIQLLMNWVETNPSRIITAEANPNATDQFSLLPIMWSSAKGHFNTTCVLQQWAEQTLSRTDQCGCSALTLAIEFGHGSLVEYLKRILKKSALLREGSLNDQCTIQLPASVTSTSKTTISEDSSPKTLGKTLAYIQAMISVQGDENDNQELSLNGHNTTEVIDDGNNTNFFDATPYSNSSMNDSCHLSPGSPAQTSLQSPFDRQIRETAEFCEFFYKAKRIEKDFEELTLTDQEQEELYRAANIIQTAYKAYKERRKQRDQEFLSATLIQSYYRRYKQYAAFKKMQKGAVLIQNHYRAHREKAKKKKSEAASLIQTYYRRYRQRKHGSGEQKSVQEINKLQQQESRKANRYLQQTSNRFSRDIADDSVQY